MAEEKILDSEKLDEEQLENVAGGTQWQMEKDIQEFKDLGVLSPGVDKHDKDAIRKAFEAYGIRAEPHGSWFGEGNKYFIGSRSISRDEAWDEVRAQARNYRPRVK